MPETFTPVQLVNDTGVKLNAAYFNRLETNMETFDDRIAANEVGVAAPLTVAYAASITLNASLSGLFRIVATGDLTLNDPINGQDGQCITVEVQASGADRVLSFTPGGASAVTIAAGQWWIGELRYHASINVWMLTDGSGGSSSGGGPSGAGLPGVFSVLSYGAVGDGTADDTAAIQATITTATTGSTVVIPGGYTFRCTASININKKLIVTGGGILNFTSGITNTQGLLVTVSGCRIDNIAVVNPNALGTQTGQSNAGILVRASEIIIRGCHVEKWQMGIAIDAQNGEYQNIIIHGNRIKDILGAGDGPSNITSSFGEDRGDGVVVWGSLATVTGNVINAMPGTDARIGIHHEALPEYNITTPAHTDAMVTITGNVIYGQFRRGIANENVSNTIISGNSIADSTWWGIGITGSRDIACTGNSIYWSRTASDNQGGAWSPTRAPILVGMSGSAGGKGSTIANNAIRCTATGAADAFIAVQCSSTLITSDLLIDGNVCDVESGASIGEGVSIIGAASNPRILNNTIRGFTSNGVSLFACVNAEIRGNYVDGLTPIAASSRGIAASSDTHTPIMITGNTVRFTDTGIERSNGTGGIISQNLISNCINGIDGFQSANTIVCQNHITVTTGSKIVNLTNGVNGNVVAQNI